jgi:cellulose biosynthesis protein BcsQ
MTVLALAIHKGGTAKTVTTLALGNELGTHKNSTIPTRVSCAPDSAMLEVPRWN